MPPTTTSEPFRFRDIAVTAYGPSLVSAIGYRAVMPVVALRARELGADIGTAAFMVAPMGIGQLCSSLPTGALMALGNGLGSGIVMTLGADHAPSRAGPSCSVGGGSAATCVVVGSLGWIGTGWVGYWTRRVSPPGP